MDRTTRASNATASAPTSSGINKVDQMSATASACDPNTPDMPSSKKQQKVSNRPSFSSSSMLLSSSSHHHRSMASISPKKPNSQKYLTESTTSFLTTSTSSFFSSGYFGGGGGSSKNCSNANIINGGPCLSPSPVASTRSPDMDRSLPLAAVSTERNLPVTALVSSPFSTAEDTEIPLNDHDDHQPKHRDHERYHYQFNDHDSHYMQAVAAVDDSSNNADNDDDDEGNDVTEPPSLQLSALLREHNRKSLATTTTELTSPLYGSSSRELALADSDAAFCPVSVAAAASAPSSASSPPGQRTSAANGTNDERQQDESLLAVMMASPSQSPDTASKPPLCANGDQDVSSPSGSGLSSSFSGSYGEEHIEHLCGTRKTLSKSSSSRTGSDSEGGIAFATATATATPNSAGESTSNPSSLPSLSDPSFSSPDRSSMERQIRELQLRQQQQRHQLQHSQSQSQTRTEQPSSDIRTEQRVATATTITIAMPTLNNGDNKSSLPSPPSTPLQTSGSKLLDDRGAKDDAAITAPKTPFYQKRFSKNWRGSKVKTEERHPFIFGRPRSFDDAGMSAFRQRHHDLLVSSSSTATKKTAAAPAAETTALKRNSTFGCLSRAQASKSRSCDSLWNAAAARTAGMDCRNYDYYRARRNDQYRRGPPIVPNRKFGSHSLPSSPSTSSSRCSNSLKERRKARVKRRLQQKRKSRRSSSTASMEDAARICNSVVNVPLGGANQTTSLDSTRSSSKELPISPITSPEIMLHDGNGKEHKDSFAIANANRTAQVAHARIHDDKLGQEITVPPMPVLDNIPPPSRHPTRSRRHSDSFIFQLAFSPRKGALPPCMFRRTSISPPPNEVMKDIDSRQRTCENGDRMRPTGYRRRISKRISEKRSDFSARTLPNLPFGLITKNVDPGTPDVSPTSPWVKMRRTIENVSSHDALPAMPRKVDTSPEVHSTEAAMEDSMTSLTLGDLQLKSPHSGRQRQRQQKQSPKSNKADSSLKLEHRQNPASQRTRMNNLEASTLTMKSVPTKLVEKQAPLASSQKQHISNLFQRPLLPCRSEEVGPSRIAECGRATQTINTGGSTHNELAQTFHEMENIRSTLRTEMRKVLERSITDAGRQQMSSRLERDYLREALKADMRQILDDVFEELDVIDDGKTNHNDDAHGTNDLPRPRNLERDWGISSLEHDGENSDDETQTFA